jgi:hypothetical protein
MSTDSGALPSVAPITVEPAGRMGAGVANLAMGTEAPVPDPGEEAESAGSEAPRIPTTTNDTTPTAATLRINPYSMRASLT